MGVRVIHVYRSVLAAISHLIAVCCPSYMTTAKMGNLEVPVLDFKALPKIEVRSNKTNRNRREMPPSSLR